MPKYRIQVVETVPAEGNNTYNQELEILHYKTDTLNIPKLVEFLGQISDKDNKDA